tara:strand:+ start:12756 stop:13112 length:357 start_codon:yes stop_codon:yes gene_type:complete
MVFREMKKLAKQEAQGENPDLSTQEKQDLRRKKLVELRKGQGAGRPSMPSRLNTREQLNMLREQEIQRVADNLNMMGGDAEVAKRYALFRRTTNSPQEEAQIEAFEEGNVSGAMPVQN